jgi:hypothetical protein
MATIRTDSSWRTQTTPESRFMHLGQTRIPVFVRRYQPPNDSYAIVAPQGYLNPGLWMAWVDHCRRHASYDVKNKQWVWSTLQIDRLTSNNQAATSTLSKEALRDARKKAEDEFDKQLAELTKNENVPEDMWPSYHYPPHLEETIPAPTALQRILVSRYWNQPSCLLGASVGTGKSRVAVDILSARALAPKSKSLNDSARIVLIVAPLSLHTNWTREIQKWQRPDVEWCVHKFNSTESFWTAVENDATQLFDREPMVTGGLVIICTPQSLSRPTLARKFAEHAYVPTAIIVDECQRLFRNPTNSAYLTMQKFRAQAHCFIALSGTPTSRLEDYWAHEELLMPGDHWRGATHSDYAKLGDPISMTSSGLWQPHFHTFDRAVKEYHAYRITKGRIFLADKRYYLKDALPGLDQEELGPFADERLSLRELFERYPDYVDAAYELQMKENPAFKGSELALVQTLLLRMQQLAALSDTSVDLLKQFVDDFLEPDEPAVIWAAFRNEPCDELPRIVRYLSGTAPTGWIMGEQTEKERWNMIDCFQNGTLRFLVAQTEAGGVGLNLIRACKCFFHTIPFGYQAVTQCIGRLHRLGQEKDVVSYYNMAHPVSAFARHIYGRRAHLNEEIPKQIGDLVKRYATTDKSR